MASNQPRDEQTVDRDGYQLTFYPGFLSRAVLREKDGTEHELFKQSGKYNLPQGRKRPDTRHRLRLEGGKRKQDITLEIHDPELRIARVTIELYGEDHDPEKNVKTAAVETLIIEEEPVRCPPNCT